MMEFLEFGIRWTMSIFLVGFLVTFIFTPLFIKKMQKNGHVVIDYYKKHRPQIPDMGGLTILAGLISSLIVAQLTTGPNAPLLTIYFVVISFAVFGLLDDLLHLGRAIKIVVPFFLALPVMLLGMSSNTNLMLFAVDFGILYYLIAPTYVMVVANLVNMHSGFNGLAIGLSCILLLTLGWKVGGLNGPEGLLFVLPVLGAMLAFWFYDMYPSKIFLGNTGSMLIGSAIGALLIFNKLEMFGVIMLIPHIINFLMYVVWRIRKVGEVKFGAVGRKGQLIVPNRLTLKWLFPYYIKLNELQATILMYVVTTIFCLVALQVS